MKQEFLRYVLVQVVAYGLDMGSFLLLVGGAGPLLANVIAKVLAGTFAFFAHRHITFRLIAEPAGQSQTGRVQSGPSQTGHNQPGRQAVRYAMLLAANIPLASLLLLAVLVLVPVPVIAKFIADVICVGLTYWLSRHLVFRAERPSKP